MEISVIKNHYDYLDDLMDKYLVTRDKKVKGSIKDTVIRYFKINPVLYQFADRANPFEHPYFKDDLLEILNNMKIVITE